MRLRRTHVGAAIWGLAEATVFYIVPDVLLSWVALKEPRKAFIACVWTLAGALIGGVFIWYLGALNPEPIRALFTFIPAINAPLIVEVQLQLKNSGLVALFIGPMIGTPYKIYALEAGHIGYGLLPFLLVSIPARLMRFVIVTAVAAAAGHYLKKIVKIGVIRILHVVVWTAFYVFYFFVMSE